MEKRLKRIEYILIGLTIITLFNTVSSLFNKTENKYAQEKVKELPEDLTKEATDRIIYVIKKNYNEADWDGIYKVLGKYAKTQIKKSDVKNQFEKLKNVTGNINTYAFSNYEFLSNEGGADWYDLFYKSSYTNGNGNIKLRIRTLDNKSEVAGININLGDF